MWVTYLTKFDQVRANTCWHLPTLAEIAGTFGRIRANAAQLCRSALSSPALWEHLVQLWRELLLMPVAQLWHKSANLGRTWADQPPGPHFENLFGNVWTISVLARIAGNTFFGA